MYKEDRLKFVQVPKTFQAVTNYFFLFPNAHSEETNETKHFCWSSAKLTYQM